MEGVQELPLVEVDPLDLDVEERVGVDPHARQVGDDAGEALLVLPLHLAEALPERRVLGEALERLAQEARSR